MTDYLLEWGENPLASRWMKAFGINAPQRLLRNHSPWQPTQTVDAAFVSIGAGLGVTHLFQNPNTTRVKAICFDAVSVTEKDGLRQLFKAIQTTLPQLDKCAKVVLITNNPATIPDSRHSSYQRAVEGVMRSLVKEVGSKGITLNMLRVDGPMDPAGLILPLQYLLSARSAFVSGQVIHVSGPHNAGSLANKVCVVTGAVGGIGSATAQRLSTEGATVICVDVPAVAEKGQALVQRLKGAQFIAADLTQTEHLHHLLSTIKTNFGGLDVLINNAGITRDKTLAKMSESQWDQVIAINLEAIFSLTEQCIERNLLRDAGRVINLSSISGIAGNFGQTNYTASKAALIAYGQQLNRQVQPRHITVNTIAPGFIETPMVHTMPFFTREAARRLSALRQGGQPEDVAEAIVFLAHPQAGAIHGQVLRVCGGNFLGG